MKYGGTTWWNKCVNLAKKDYYIGNRKKETKDDFIVNIKKL